MTDRSRYAPGLQALLHQLDQEGLTTIVRAGRSADIDQVIRLAGLGLVSSSRRRLSAGEKDWRLYFTKVGSALRKLLAAEAARA